MYVTSLLNLQHARLYIRQAGCETDDFLSHTVAMETKDEFWENLQVLI